MPVPDLPAPAGDLPAAAGLAQLLEQASAAGLWSWTTDTGRLQVSATLARLLGVPPGWVPGPDQAFDFIAPEWREAVQTGADRCARTGAPFDLPAQLLTAARRRLWVRVLGQAVRDPQGRIVRVEGAVLPGAPLAVGADALLTVDGSGRLSYLNEEAERLLGQTAEQLHGRGLARIFQRTARQRVEARLQSALAGRAPLELEELSAGQDRWLELRGQPFAAGLALHLRDVTARHHSQEQLRLLEGSISRLNDIVIITEAGPFNEPGPRIVFVNEAFERRTGYTRQEALGRSPRFLQGPRTQRERLDQVRSALEQWQPVRVDLVNYRKDGEPFWVDLDISPVWDARRASSRTGWRWGVT